MSANAAELHPDVTDAFLTIMRARRPDLLWTVTSPPDETYALPDRRSLAA